MSKYTTELRYVCETLSGLDESKGYNNIMEVIENARSKIFDFTYPIPDEYKQGLEQKILLHFYTREIGQETYGLWKLRLHSKMIEIMPYYNELYKSLSYEYEPFKDVDYSITSNRKIDSTGNTTTSSTDTTSNTGKTTNKFSDTPQGSLQNIENNTYLTNATINDSTDTTNSNSSGTGSSTGNSNDDYTEHVTGKRSGITYATAMKEYRDSIINIDMQVINDLETLFMLVY